MRIAGDEHGAKLSFVEATCSVGNCVFLDNEGGFVTNKPIRLIQAHVLRVRSLFRYGFDLVRRFFFSPPSLVRSESSPI